MKFAIPFSLSAIALSGLAWFMANREPIQLPAHLVHKEKTPVVLSAK